VPDWHRPSDVVPGKDQRGEPATNKNSNTKSADAVSCNGRDGFQQIRVAWEISSTVGQHGYWLW
jgi:hypothetical protein